MSEGIHYYDHDGMPISMMRWAVMFEDLEGRVVDRTDVWGDERAVVSTVWLGLDHSHGDGPPLIFESMCFFFGRRHFDHGPLLDLGGSQGWP